MLIKTVIDNVERYISESTITDVTETAGGAKWLIYRISGEQILLPKDDNEPFSSWLDQQIGGDAWQRDREWRKNHRQRMSGMLLDAALEATDATLEAIEKVEQCQISIT